MNEKNNFALARRPSSAVEKAAPGAKRILSGMVADVQLENWFRAGEKYYNGWDVPQDYAEAVKWYRKAAEKNHAAAQQKLGICYLRGDGVKEDCAEAEKWYRKAAEQGHAVAQISLGNCLVYGDHLDYPAMNPDVAEALLCEAAKWYRKAAEQNHAKGQFELGFCYAAGQGVPEDFVEAYKFYKLAAEQNLKDAVERLDSIVKQMTSVEIAEGKRRIRKFRLQQKLSK